jgi:excisionase family DNA binding protein
VTTEPVDSMAIEELLAAPTVVDVEFAARALGIGRTTAYGLVREGKWPTPVLRLGHKYRIPTQGLLDALGITRQGDGE